MFVSFICNVKIIATLKLALHVGNHISSALHAKDLNKDLSVQSMCWG